jgi:hypothetical protein
METFRAYYTEIRASDWQQQAAIQLRERGPRTFSGIAERARLIGLARQLMTIRPRRDADAESVTVITKTRDQSSGYTGFTDAELIPLLRDSGRLPRHPLEPVGPDRKRTRLDDLAWLSTEAAGRSHCCEWRSPRTRKHSGSVSVVHIERTGAPGCAKRCLHGSQEVCGQGHDRTVDLPLFRSTAPSAMQTYKNGRR